MSKRSMLIQETMYCGIDVSAKILAVAIQRGASARRAKELPEHFSWAQSSYRLAAEGQITGSSLLEATGIYSLDLAFALDAAEGIEIAVLNPKVANRFAQTIRRSKTDAADAGVG